MVKIEYLNFEEWINIGNSVNKNKYTTIKLKEKKIPREIIERKLKNGAVKNSSDKFF